MFALGQKQPKVIREGQGYIMLGQGQGNIMYKCHFS